MEKDSPTPLPSFSNLTLEINGKVKNVYGEFIAAANGFVCANFQAVECDTESWRTTRMEIYINENGHFDSSFMIQAGQQNCSTNKVYFKTIHLYVEVPSNNGYYPSLTPLHNMCAN